MDNFRDRVIKSSWRDLENTTLLPTRHFDQQFEEFEVIQKNLVAYIRSMGIASNDAYRRLMSSKDMHERLKIMSNGSSDAASVNTFDSDGMLINSSISPLLAVNVADRRYFKAFQSDNASTSSRIELLESRMTGASTALISRPMTDSDGEFSDLLIRLLDSQSVVVKTPRSASSASSCRSLAFLASGSMRANLRYLTARELLNHLV